MLPCGTLAHDFTGTPQARREPSPVGRLNSPGLIDSWFGQAGLLDEEPGSAEADLRAERRSTAWFRARLDAEPLSGWAVTAVNRRTSAPPVTTTLITKGAARYGPSGAGHRARETIEFVAGQEAAGVAGPLLRSAPQTDPGRRGRGPPWS
ncbi:ABATE domain-containing protein [Streptomyces sp. NPDC093516]|uniref:ABATE domain-containing protein n=1 Tax=Streptomyces sp. NPDC093516 TaxID=3155304 RepID=UPI003434375B